MNFDILNKHRIKNGFWASNDNDPFGVFLIRSPVRNFDLKIICSNLLKEEWEHVSVSIENRVPNWDEMCFVKNLFWDEEKTVVQFHPKKTEYINNHHFCLHLWRRKSFEYELPPSIMVGV